MNSTKDLKNDHMTIRRVKDIAQKCSDNLYSAKEVPLVDIKILSEVIEQFVDNFHH
jgi:hemerythrin-like domain-containing protein